ncbi:hypothetical protein [Donghicola tyrosinivorans]|uniref:PDZ domain-containing protein n=1 Tax=Donghicola tyrosinivorans TaxID=1652492 RepID=A0A2T0WIE2_9RHOB|nr:hypothetical protein [Donghicola tyrosinivorans]PRY86481.1 hypothetical protein CLV74_112120 [Donghicola tyrosinivorans]
MSTEPASNDTDSKSPPAHRLKLKALDVAAIALGLKSGDELIAVNGLPFDGGEMQLRERFGRKGITVALTFEREGRKFVVLASNPNLGTWTRGAEYDAAEAAKNAKRILPDGLINWEVYRDINDVYDLQQQRPSALAIALTPLWLAQMRLWTPLAIWVATIIVTAPIGLYVVLLTQVLAWTYFWNTGPEFFRRDRIARGMKPFMVIAASSEAKVHGYLKKEFPELHFVYDPVPRVEEHEVEAL